jgi:hypothetical protein
MFHVQGIKDFLPEDEVKPEMLRFEGTHDLLSFQYYDYSCGYFEL